MVLFDTLRNGLNRILGRQQDFEELLKNKDIDGAISRMEDRSSIVDKALAEYDVQSHEIMKKPDRIVTDKKGNYLRTEKPAKNPIPWQVYINEIALVFLYGRPVKWQQNTEGTDDAYQAYTDFIKRTRFNSKIRECKRYAGAETESAMLFRVFRNEEGKADCQIRILAKSKGDDIRVMRDQYENFIAFGWGYHVKEKNSTVYHFDIFTASIIYRCKKTATGWECNEEENIVGKIPVIYFMQEVEWAGTQALIERSENIASKTSDTNDYFADPIAIINADIVKNLPEKKDANKLLIVKSGENVDNAFKYATWDSAPQSKKEEMEWLEDKIHMMSFSPKISLETMKSISQLSAKALKTVMLLADIKAARRKESHDELLDRTASLITAIIGNVLDVGLKGQCAKLSVSHEYQEPFGDDIESAINNIIKLYDAGLESRESAVELNPMVKDPQKELQRLEQEEQKRLEQQRQQQEDLFKQTEGQGEITASAQ